MDLSPFGVRLQSNNDELPKSQQVNEDGTLATPSKFDSAIS